MLLLIHSGEFWMTRNNRQYCWSWHASIISYTSSALPLHFPFVSIDSFLPEADLHSKKSWKLIFTSDLESWWTKCGKSSISVELSWYSNSTFLKTTFLNSSIKVWIGGDIFLKVFFRRNKLWLFPLDWNDDKPNMQKGSINVFSMSIFKLIIL